MQETKSREDVFAGLELVGSDIRLALLSPSASLVLDKKTFKGDDAPAAVAAFLAEGDAEFGVVRSAGLAFATGLESVGARVGADLFKIFGGKPATETSARAGAIGESEYGAGRGKQTFFFLTLGTPVGAALMLNGSVWRGQTGLAGEFGSMVVGADGRTVNDFATDESILRRTRNRFNQDHTSTLVGLDEGTVKVSDLVREALLGDEFAQMMLERTGRFAGIAVGGVISLLNVDTVIVGGEIVREGTGVLEGVVAGASEHCFPAAFQAAEIIPAELGEYSAAVGAALISSRSGELSK